MAWNNFEKHFFKLMNNAVFGKTMENIRKHRDFNLVTNEDAYLKRVAKPNLKSGIIFSENLIGKIRVVMKKPNGEDQSCNEQTCLPRPSHSRSE